MVNESVVCTRDDKSKKIIFVPEDMYTDLLSDFIAQSNLLLLDYDPTDKITGKVASLLKSDTFPDVWKVKNVNCPHAPRLFGYIKTHKNPVSIRPMVDKVSSPLYELEKTIAAWAAQCLKGYKYTITSLLDFLDRFLQYGLFPNESYSILDYESLHPLIKLAPAALMLYRFLLQHLPESSCDPRTIRDICHLITYNSYFMFQGQYYLQTTGVPIGGPIAGVMAELVVRYRESIVLESFESHIQLYLRYVD